jgi:hypothetical protein
MAVILDGRETTMFQFGLPKSSIEGRFLPPLWFDPHQSVSRISLEP